MQLLKISLVIILLLGINLKAFSQELSIFPIVGFEYYQDDQQISKPELEALLSQNVEAYNDWQKSIKDRRTAFIFMGAEVGFAIWGLSTIQQNDSNVAPAIALIGMLGTGAGSFIFSISSLKSKRNAILKYNKGLKATTSIDFGLQSNGMGLALNF